MTAPGDDARPPLLTPREIAGRALDTLELKAETRELLLELSESPTNRVARLKDLFRGGNDHD